MLVALLVAGCATETTDGTDAAGERSVDVRERPRGDDRRAEPVPDLSLMRNETGDLLQVVRTHEGVAWEDFRFRARPDPVRGAVERDPSGGLVIGERWTAVAEGPMEAGQALRLCGGTTGTTVLIMHEASNTLVYEGTFRTVAAC